MLWVLLAVIVVLVATVGLIAARRQRTRKLKSEFGPEYKRAVARRGDQGSAEKELTERRRRVSRFEIRPLEYASRRRYEVRWKAVQRSFVDEPEAAVGEAHALVQRVMHDRGYPVEEDFEQRAADISVDHPDVVENYRAAHTISVRARNSRADTEQLRQSMVHFRALFAELLAPGDSEQPRDGDSNRAATVTQQTTRS